MPARTGDELIQALRDSPMELWHRGRKVEDITAEDGIAGGVRSLAARYDFQHEEPETLLFPSPQTGDPVGMSFMIPETREDLVRVGDSMHRLADFSFGMAGRDPSYLNRAMSAYAAAASWLDSAHAGGGANAAAWHRDMRERDLALTHTLINPQINRAVSAAKQADPFLAARVKEETDAGLVIKGARMLATLPISDSIMVFPSTLLKNPEEDAPYSFAFCLPNATEGLKFICRETVDYGRNHFDHPLGSRYEELDALVVFDDVFVPWENVFLYRDVKACNEAYAATSAVVHMSHQVICKNIAKTEFLLGLVSLMIDAVGIEIFQHVQEKVAEIWVNLETMKAFRRAAEADAAVNEHGMMTPAFDPLDAARNLYPRLYPRMVEIVRLLGASGLVAMPTEADLKGPLSEEVHRYYQAARLEAKDRIPLYRLAWDTALSAFAARQVQYETYFFGDPVRMAGAIFHSKDRTPYMERVREFLRTSSQDDG
ncbi:MAG: 4-hydroxyphenylacetate 3-monooxygenase, oxygenase component [Gammaproteobacteria bacterium]|nr:4-hydroxyphenylacetate 3-monooxygenase, oxygenase component [Gammaproteobacteria bacterium]